MIHVLATVTAKPGMRDRILEAFRANMPAVHAEEGCIEYGPAIDLDDAGPIQTKLGPDTFVVIEKWSSLDTLKAHAASPHMAAYGARTRDMIASRVIHPDSSRRVTQLDMGEKVPAWRRLRAVL